ncbi:hypothetical protein ACTQ5K_09635 [Niallia sp. Sow4_A1]|uniref:hypothetical protein n=1 Tax=Bacillaceae TaxID=186817 RepID=UPI000660D6B5|nr:hypothetical protein [Bacillus sp. 522_BSPC]
MTTVKKVSLICSLVLITSIGGFGIYEWIAKDEINATTIFYLFLGIGFLFHSLTWGEMEGKHEGKKDELEKHITLLSSKISYYLLLVLMVLVLILTEQVTAMNDIKNLPLVIVIGLAFVTLPITEFVVSRKYR